MSESPHCIVIAIFTPLRGHIDDVREILTAIIPEVHDEDGCELYALHEDTEGRLVFVESWTTRALWEKHKNHSTVESILTLTKPHLSREVEVIEMYSVAAGNLSQGLLIT
jgi:quinol monooxygenase YgiN